MGWVSGYAILMMVQSELILQVSLKRWKSGESWASSHFRTEITCLYSIIWLLLFNHGNNYVQNYKSRQFISSRLSYLNFYCIVQNMNLDQSSASIKINHHFKTLSQIQNFLSLKNHHLHHLSQLNTALSKPIHPPAKKNIIQDFNVKVTQLQTQTIFAESQLKKQSWVNSKSTKCKISDHLRHVLTKEKDQTHDKNIKQLERKKKALEKTIWDKLVEDEPYIHQKIFSRIGREAQKKRKLATIKELEKVIHEKKNWLLKNKQKATEEAMNKEVENMVGANLQKMKDIMVKKVQLNDYIYEVSCDERNISKTKEKLNKISSLIEERISEMKKIMEEELLEAQLEEHESPLRGVALSQAEKEDLNRVRKEVNVNLRRPLETEKSGNMAEKIEFLQKELLLVRKNKL